ncbi:hypothetical protein [Limobrevibacterium gyesilva]|uniref:Uncharacterized protein n=1 Tax=Limobrevibacterium gyesilva TaxID=2991712 RepID=A0AA41YNC0_9PROT|nr:hypothetical protein [Limobrevibacterium gyesilva]MCW3475691.1 hypothetical protein [Limobrevibacterium gyesilva]
MNKTRAALFSYAPLLAGVVIGIGLSYGVPAASTPGAKAATEIPGHVFDFRGFRCNAADDDGHTCTPIPDGERPSFTTMDACTRFSQRWVDDRNDPLLKGGCFEKLAS